MITDPSELWTIQERGIPLYMNNTLTIRPERRDEFVAALRDVLPHARAEAGCSYLEVGELTRDPNVFILSEGWRDLVEYRDEILAKDYFQKYLKISEDAYAVPRVVELLRPVDVSS
ncbi:putative quinol monooxygenase [Actinoplanes sp. M2I2]|uniref:putative quinol monooxygenase n=1 Tax=Actinoplanes sp. M2I2 TaxID=1734444 RepID=UPI00201FC111|nr:antibiotic biosynthesis monooxygenase [Actinoplanes sp. M2I2]